MGIVENYEALRLYKLEQTPDGWFSWDQLESGEGQTFFASEILISALQPSLGLGIEDKPRIGN